MADRLSEKSDCAIVSYDAWVHAGDPLRKAFLFSVIEQLLAKNWLKDVGTINANKYWAEQKDKLERRLKISEKKTTPSLTLFGRAFVLTLLMLPFCAPIASEGLKDIVRNGLINSIRIADPSFLFIQIPAIFITSLPALLVIVGAIFYKIKGANLDEMFALLINKTTVNERTETLENPEPTSLEFQKVFDDLLDQALRNDKRKLVLVVDNLDRLTTTEADSVWSLLRSFIDNSSFTSRAWFSRLWVIVPISGVAMIVGKEEERPPSAPSLPADRDKFLEKVFQIRFTLPPAALASWKKFLVDLLEQALTKSDYNSFDNVVRVYENHLTTSGDSNNGGGQISRSPTPRELIRFVNDLVTLRLQWPSNFDIAVMGAYLLDSRNAGDTMAALQSRFIPAKENVRLLGKAIAADYAALFFNVSDVQQAQHLLLRPLIEKLLLSEGKDELRELLTNDAGATEVLDGVLAKSLTDWAENNVNNVFCCISTLRSTFELQHSGMTEEISKATKLKDKTNNLIADHVGRAISSLPFLPLDNAACARGVVAYVEMYSNREATPRIILGALKKFGSTEGGASGANATASPAADNIASWFANLSLICAHPTMKEALTSDSSSRIELPLDSKLWVQFCEEFSQHDTSWMLSAFTSSSDISLHANYLQSRIDAGTFDRTCVPVVVNEGTRDGSVLFERFATDLSAALAIDVDFSRTFLDAVFPLSLQAMKHSAAAVATFDSAVDSGWLHHTFWLASQKQSTIGKAAIALLILRRRPDGSIVGNVGNAASGASDLLALLSDPLSHVALVDAIAAEISNCKIEEIFANIATADGINAAFVEQVVERISNVDEVFKAIFNSGAFSASADKFIAKLYPTDPSKKADWRTKLIAAGVQKFQLVERMLETDWATICPWIYVCAFENAGREHQGFLEKLQKHLRTFTSETWLALLRKSNWDVSLLVNMQAASVPANLDRELRDALMNLAKELAVEPTATAIEPSALKSVVHSMAPSQKAGLGEDLYELVANRDSALTAEFWGRFGFLVVETGLKLGPSGRVVRRLIIPSINRNDYGALELVPDLLRKLPEAAIKDETSNLIEARDSVNRLSLDQTLSTERKELLDEIVNVIANFLPAKGDEDRSSKGLEAG